MKSMLLTVASLLSHAAIAQTLTPLNYGAVKFGQKLSQAEFELHQHASPGEGDGSCAFVTFARYPRVKFMVEAGIVTRADAMLPVRNSAGIDLGTTLSSARERFPNARVEPHKYDPNGHYFIIETPDKKAALLFEESGGRLTDARAGTLPSVEYVEGCL